MAKGTHRVSRYHDICCGHRVVGQGGKCEHLHGHNYRVHFTCEALVLDDVGRVLDFSVIKEKLCLWIERVWDHKLLIWTEDPYFRQLQMVDYTGVVPVPFNPTAENMAFYLVHSVGPLVLGETGVRLVKVVIDETTKCSASYEIDR